MHPDSAPRIKVLFIDDEPLILRTVERAMRGEKYDVFFAKGAFEALDVLAREQIDIVVSDYDMPLVNGMEILELLRTQRRDVVRIMMTGRLAVSAWEAGVDEGSVQRLIEKPWRPDTLRRVLAEAADAVTTKRRSDPDIHDTVRFRRPLSLS